MKRLLLASAFILISAGPLAAGEEFGRMDTNGDGVVNWEEFSAAYPSMREPAFAAIDTNNDKQMSHEEWHMFRDRHGKDGKGMEGMDSASGMKMPPEGMTMPPKGMMKKEGGKQLIMPPSGQKPEGGKMMIEPPKE
ncbi:calcium-binding protein [Oleidesulfovibrio sp.]|uniref:calcium-binding protein n=1 Tax=Oleidesulfovibrio sp. TaxID=2909707 RepID=UPI003A8AB300